MFLKNQRLAKLSINVKCVTELLKQSPNFMSMPNVDLIDDSILNNIDDGYINIIKTFEETIRGESG